jgi:hypothetical protein
MPKEITPLKGRPPRADKDNKKVPSVERGTKPGEQRKTYIVNIELANKIDAVAHWEYLSVKDVVNEALVARLAKYEKKNGPVKPVKK